MNDMVDMSQFVEAKSDQLNSDDLIGSARTITVTRVTGSDSNEQPVVVHFQGDNGKPWKPCKTMRRVLLGVWGKHASKYAGRSMTLYRDDSVTFGGLEVGGIRISHMSHIDEPKVVVVNKMRGKKAGIKVLPLKAEQQSDDARTWTDKFIANVARAPDAEKLDAFVAGKESQLASLEEKRPELRQECQRAIADRRASFIADDGDNPFGADPEYPADGEDERGEG